MGRLKRQHYDGAVYHAMSRGNNGQIIFYDPGDFAAFLAILADVARKTRCRVLAYCLMSNHFHLLLEVGTLPLDNVMRRLLTRYSKYFNIKRKCFGHVFQARYLAKLCQGDRYYQRLLRYIHRNPSTAGLVEAPADWPWSTHRQYIGPIRSTLTDVDRGLSFVAADAQEARRIYADIMSEADDGFSPVFEDSQFSSWRSRPTRVEPESLESIEWDCGFDIRGVGGHNRRLDLSNARRLFAQKALAAGHAASAIARFLGIDRSAVSHALRHCL